MSWLPASVKFSILIFLCAGFVSACGVKGDPLPPEKPVELGRGRPTYRRATEGMKIEHQRSIHDEEEDEDKKDDDN